MNRTTLLIAGLVLALLVVIALSLLLLREARGGYRDAALARLDPLQLRAFPPIERPTGALLVFYGDSRADQWPLPEVPGYTALNRGIGGQTSAQVLLRYEAHIAPLRPDVLVLQVGINDLKTIGVLEHRRDQIVAETKANIGEIVRRARADGATVVLTTIFPIGPVPPARQFIWSAEIGPAVEEVNAYMRTLAEPQVIVFDAAQVVADGAVVRAEYARDTLHLTPAGYAALNADLFPVLKQIPRRK